MGDPKKFRKKFSRPRHPWQRQRLEAEKELSLEYGLKNKKQLWKMISILNGYTGQAKSLTPKLQSLKSEQAEKEAKLFLEKLSGLGLLGPGANLTDVLNLSVRNVLDRRLQTLVYKKGLARSASQARQFITHGHIKIDDRKVTSPSYLVKISEEGLISYASNSPLTDANHPERVENIEAIAQERKNPAKKVSETKSEEVKEDASVTTEESAE
jgi:small subunit ribosomal protein S4